MLYNIKFKKKVVDIIHPGRANVSKAELQEKVGAVTEQFIVLIHEVKNLLPISAFQSND
jgi:hypothetical protein